MNSLGIYFLVYAYIIIGILAYLQTFYSVLSFKWYIDMYYLRDKSCLKKNWAKFEIESYRYNIYSFLFNYNEKESYKYIYESYKTSYYIFITFLSSFLILYLGMILYPLKRGMLNTEDNMYSYFAYFVVVIIYIIYTTVNSILLTKFEHINNMISDSNSAIQTYHNTYKILNAVMQLNSLENVVLEYKSDKLNEIQETFGVMIEKNIASLVNTSNTSKVKQIKMISYDNLDFLKYFTFDKISPYYLKYFDNVFIILPEDLSVEYDISQNLYLSEILMKRNNYVNFENVRLEFDAIMNAIKTDKRDTYMNIYLYLTNNYPDINDFSIMNDCYTEIKNVLNNDTVLEEYNNTLFISIQKNLQTIHDLLQSNNDNKIYKKVNDMISEKIKEKKIEINIPKNDYIKYYLDNKGILFDTEYERDARFKDLIQLLDSYSNYIYAYFVYFIFLFFVFSHYLYININDMQYVYIMLSIIMLYFAYGYISYLFRNSDAQ
jgi:hypothetical protein